MIDVMRSVDSQSSSISFSSAPSNVGFGRVEKTAHFSLTDSDRPRAVIWALSQMGYLKKGRFSESAEIGSVIEQDPCFSGLKDTTCGLPVALAIVLENRKPGLTLTKFP